MQHQILQILKKKNFPKKEKNSEKLKKYFNTWKQNIVGNCQWRVTEIHQQLLPIFHKNSPKKKNKK